MAKLKLTHKIVQGLFTERKREIFWDEDFPPGGWFGVACYSSGEKSFTFSYRNRHGRQKQITLGSTKTTKLADARAQAIKLLVDINSGIDPAHDKRQHRLADTVEALCQRYMDLHAHPNLTPKTKNDYQRIINKEILPSIGHYKAGDVRRADIIRLLDEIYISRKKRTLACHTRSILHAVFEFGVARGILNSSPCVGLPRMERGRPRDRVLADQEVSSFLQAVSTESPAISGLFKLLLHTGQRSGEVCGMKWSEINGDEWHLSGERTKNKKAHIVPLTHEARRILGQIKTFQASTYFTHRTLKDFVFASPESDTGHITWINKACRRICKKAGVNHFSPHDLRRTATTGLVRLGASTDIVGKILNHSGQSVTSRHYDRAAQLTERRQLLDKWSKKLADLESTQAQKRSA